MLESDIPYPTTYFNEHINPTCTAVVEHNLILYKSLYLIHLKFKNIKKQMDIPKNVNIRGLTNYMPT